MNVFMLRAQATSDTPSDLEVAAWFSLVGLAASIAMIWATGGGAAGLMYLVG